MNALNLSGQGPSPAGVLATLLAASDVMGSSRIVLAVPPHRSGPPIIHLWTARHPSFMPGLSLTDTASAHALTLHLFTTALDDNLTSWRPGAALRWRAPAPGPTSGRMLMITQLPLGDGGYALDIAPAGLRPLGGSQNRLTLATRRNDPRMTALFRAYPEVERLDASHLTALSALLGESADPLTALDHRLATIFQVMPSVAPTAMRKSSGGLRNGPFLIPATGAHLAGLAIGILVPFPRSATPEAWLFSPGWAPLPDSFLPIGSTDIFPVSQKDGHP